MAVNYKIEGGFDFYGALALDCSSEGSEADEENVCLITAEPLDMFAVTLPCGHSFNYQSLHKDVRAQKSSACQSLSDFRLRHNQFKCPYCRRVYDKLLPFVSLDGVVATNGVDSPSSSKTLNVFPCRHVISRGKRAGEMCGRPSLIPKEAFLCGQHLKKKEERKTCQAILKSGKRKGEKCGAICRETLCKRHLPKN